MITEIREADTKEKRTEVLKKYGVLLTEEEFDRYLRPEEMI